MLLLVCCHGEAIASVYTAGIAEDVSAHEVAAALVGDAHDEKGQLFRFGAASWAGVGEQNICSLAFFLSQSWGSQRSQDLLRARGYLDGACT